MKILYLCRRYYWDQKFSRGRFCYVEAMARQSGVDLRCSGDGFTEWDQRLTLAENVARWDWKPDVVWCYKAQDHRGVAEFDALKVVTFNEANHEKTREEIDAADARLIVFHHENDMPLWRGLEAEGRRLVHILHGAESDVFLCERTIAERRVECIVTGTTSPEVYPLRNRMARLIQSGRVNGRVRPHPGYRLPSREACDVQFRAYASDLQHAKISLCCTSRFRYALAKLVESMMAGCVVVSDIPDDSEFRETLGPHVVTVSHDASDGEIVEVVGSLLYDPERMQRIATAGQQAAMEFTCDRYAERLLAALAK